MRAGLRGDGGPVVFEKDPGSAACPGFIPPIAGVLEMWPQSFCARESVKIKESNPSKQPCRLVLPMYIVERFPFLTI